ncbi:MAG: hypothetical protein ABI835_04965 [Chloroflexota bacterium]
MLLQPRLLVPFAFERRVFKPYLLRVEFATDDPAPIASPYSGEVGSLNIVDTGNKLSVSGGELVPVGASSGASDPALVSAASFARLAGRTFAARAKVVTASGQSGVTTALAGFASSSSPSENNFVGIGLLIGGTSVVVVDSNGYTLTAEPISGDVYYTVHVVLRSAGAYLFFEKKLVWVVTVGTPTPLYPAVYHNVLSGRSLFGLDYLRLRDLSSPFDTDYGIATLHTAALSGSDYAAVANGIFDLVVSAPGSLAGSAGLKFRKNGGDYWKVYFDSAGALLLQRYDSNVAQGSPVTLATSVISGSATRTLRVVATGTKLDFFTQSGTTWTKRGSSQTDSDLSANTGLSPFADSAWTSGGGALGQIDAWARTASPYDLLDSV